METVNARDPQMEDCARRDRGGIVQAHSGCRRSLALVESRTVVADMQPKCHPLAPPCTHCRRCST